MKSLQSCFAIMLVCVLLMPGAGLRAQENPFHQCVNTFDRVARANCKIAVVNDYLKEYYGDSAFQNANLRAERECPRDVFMNRRKPNLAGHLECVFEVKKDFYQKLGE